MGLFTNCRKLFEYVPLVILLTIMFVAGSEMDKNLIKASWTAVLTFVVLVIAYLLLVVFRLKNRIVVVFLLLVVWVVMIYIRNCIVKDDD